MFKDLGKTTPRDILKASGLYIEKPIPDDELLKEAVDDLPIKDRHSMHLVGTGDYDRASSTGGTVVLSKDDENNVFKFQLGTIKDKSNISTNQTRNSINRALSMKEIACKHGDNMPTEFFIAKINDQPKVVTMQRKSDVPICDVPFIQIMESSFLKQSDETMKLISNLKSRYGFNDFVGLNVAKPSNLTQKVITYFLYNTPWFSDNIMVNKDSAIEITDNTPRGSNPDLNNYTRFLRKFKSNVIWKSIVIFSHTYNLFNKMLKSNNIILSSLKTKFGISIKE